MQRMFSIIIEKIEYVEKPQFFEVYQKETLVCRWTKTTWWRTSNAQQNHGEDFQKIRMMDCQSITKIS
jgi:hypothetical protein